MTSRKKGRIGSSFDDFLKDEGVYNEVETVAVKRVIAWQLEEAMKARRMSKLQMARRMKTSRSQLDRLLDPSHSGVTLETLARAAQVLGRHIRVELV
jgi:DNA-binding Xre family transcriptional regulator